MITPNYLVKLNASQVLDMAEFVVSENFKHHSRMSDKEDLTSEVNSIFDEELTYHSNAEFFVGRDSDGAIVGTIRVLKWNLIDPLPLQKVFGINPLSHLDTSRVNDIYHIGRFAIQKSLSSLKLFKKLLVCAIEPVCRNKRNVAFAECDGKLLRVLSRMGIGMHVIGKPIHYLGSDTIPVLLTYDGLIHFFNETVGALDKCDQGSINQEGMKQIAI